MDNLWGNEWLRKILLPGMDCQAEIKTLSK